MHDGNYLILSTDGSLVRERFADIERTDNYSFTFIQVESDAQVYPSEYTYAC